jgi:hypothetical protein
MKIFTNIFDLIQPLEFDIIFQLRVLGRMNVACTGEEDEDVAFRDTQLDCYFKRIPFQFHRSQNRFCGYI